MSDDRNGSNGSAAPPSPSHECTSFPQFLRLPTVMQHAIWSFAPRRSLLTRYAPLCRSIHTNTRPLVERASSRAPKVTKRDMHGWIARLDSACSAMRQSVLSAAALDPDDMALLYVSAVPPRSNGERELESSARAGTTARGHRDESQEAHRRAMEKLRAQSAADSVSSGGCGPSIPILRESNVCDRLQRTPVSELQDASVRQILSQARWVLGAYKSVWRASLLRRQRDEMERLQQRHEDRLNDGLDSDFDYCATEDAFVAQMEGETQRWECDVQDLLFELQFVMLAMLIYSEAEAKEKEAAAAEATAAATVAAAEAQATETQSLVHAPGGASIPDSSPCAASPSRCCGVPTASVAPVSPVACLYSLERVHINDPEQDLWSAEGRAGCRYTTHVHVFPVAKSRAQEEEEAEREEQRRRHREKEREAEEEAERVRAMLRRMDGTEARVHDASVTPLSAEAALQRAQAEQLRLEMLAAFKGAPVPEPLAHKYSSAVQQAAAKVTGASSSASATGFAAASAAAASVSRAAAAAAAVDLDLPYFFIATSHFRDEKRANNSRRSMAIR